MSTASRKGYAGEHLTELWLEDALGRPLERPRAGAPQDRGDLLGLPFTISVKNRAQLALSVWVDEMALMARHNGHEAGIVVHKRPRKGQPGDWYVTTRGELWLPFAHAYVERHSGGDR